MLLRHRGSAAVNGNAARGSVSNRAAAAGTSEGTDGPEHSTCARAEMWRVKDARGERAPRVGEIAEQPGIRTVPRRPRE